MLGGRALREQWWWFPYFGRNDPKVVEELIGKVGAGRVAERIARPGPAGLENYEM